MRPKKQMRLRDSISRSRVIVAALWSLLGVVGGVAAYTFAYANGASYFSNDPHACANCHVMHANLDSWRKSSHHAVATCNDCHAPHDNVLHKYFVKAVNGYNHSLAFTTGNFEDNFHITEFNRAVTETTCRSCHEDTVHAIESKSGRDTRLACIRCHRDVGHR